MSSFANEAIYGAYSGTTKKNKKCSIVVDLENGNVKINISLSKRLVGKKKYSFINGEWRFFKDLAQGNTPSSNHEDNPVTDYSRDENLNFTLHEDGTLDSYHLMVKRSGPFTIDAEGEIECLNLKK